MIFIIIATQAELLNFYITMMWGNMGMGVLNAILWLWHGRRSLLATVSASVCFAICFNNSMNQYANTYGYIVKPVYTTGIWPYWYGQAFLLATQVAMFLVLAGVVRKPQPRQDPPNLSKTETL